MRIVWRSARSRGRGRSMDDTAVLQECGDSMAEAVPRVSVQALRAFFTQHIEAALKKSRMDGEMERRRRQGRPLSVMPTAVEPVVEERPATTDSASRMAKSASMGDLNRLLAKLRPVTKSRNGHKVTTSTSSLFEAPMDTDDSGQKPGAQRIPRFSYHAIPDSHLPSTLQKDTCRTRTGDTSESECGSNKQKCISEEVHKLHTKEESVSTSPVTSSNSFHYQNTPVLSLPKHLSSLVTSDNYVSKAKLRYRKKQIPPKEEAGPPPVKPPKPPYVTLSTSRNHRQMPFLHRHHNGLAYSRPLSTSAPVLTSKPSRLPPAPPTTVPAVGLRPFRPLPLPPGLSCRSASPRLLNGFSAARREVKSYSHDRLSKDDDNSEPLIPEYTEEEELGDSCLSLQDAGLPRDDFYYCVPPTLPPPLRPRKYLSSPLACFSSRSITSPDELYQDATSAGSEGVYEVVPGDCSEEEPTYGTKMFSRQREVAISIRKKLQIFHREEQKRIKKEREKRDKEFEKLRKKFSLTGTESPLDMGLVKNDSKGSRLDLSVKKGEPVLILRMENNPSGRWLVRNEKGKIGYVELTNIEMDADSIKSVMAMRTTLRSEGENDPFVDEEGIYEETLY